MAVKAIAMPVSMSIGTAGEFSLELYVVTNDGATQFYYTVTNLPINILESTLNGALKTAIRNEMVNHWGFTMGLLDTVTILGVNLSL